MDARKVGRFPMSSVLSINNRQVAFEVKERKSDKIRFILNDKEYIFSGQRLPHGAFVLEQELANHIWQRFLGYGAAGGKAGYKIQLDALEVAVHEATSQSVHSPSEARLAPLAPMPGMIRQVLVKAGETVSAGQALIVLEAMKLQLTLSAGGEAKVDALLVEPGQMVGEGSELVKLSPVKSS